MSKKKVKIEATYAYEIEVDTQSSCVKDYDSERGLFEDLVHYRFTTLPVIGRGVSIKDVDVLSHEVISDELMTI